MKIVNRDEFLKMPKGTIYATGEKWALMNWNVKGESCGNDWFYDGLEWSSVHHLSTDIDDKLEDSLNNGTSLEMDFHRTSRDGAYAAEDVFAVMEKDDILKMIDRLKECL